MEDKLNPHAYLGPLGQGIPEPVPHSIQVNTIENGNETLPVPILISSATTAKLQVILNHVAKTPSISRWPSCEDSEDQRV